MSPSPAEAACCVASAEQTRVTPASGKPEIQRTLRYPSGCAQPRCLVWPHKRPPPESAHGGAGMRDRLGWILAGGLGGALAVLLVFQPAGNYGSEKASAQDH